MLAEPPGRTLENAGNGIPRVMAAALWETLFPAVNRTRLIEGFHRDIRSSIHKYQVLEYRSSPGVRVCPGMMRSEGAVQKRNRQRVAIPGKGKSSLFTRRPKEESVANILIGSDPENLSAEGDLGSWAVRTGRITGFHGRAIFGHGLDGGE